MEILTVWKKPGVALYEKCLWSTSGYYVGLKTGTHYLPDDHYHEPQLRAIIRGADEENETGMYHLYADQEGSPVGEVEENRRTWKHQFIGCCVTVEEAHNCGELKIYRCLELDEYFSANELELLSPTP